jgi:hypothetical protein
MNSRWLSKMMLAASAGWRGVKEAHGGCQQLPDQRCLKKQKAGAWCSDAILFVGSCRLHVTTVQSDCHQTVSIYDPFKWQPFVAKAVTSTAYKQQPQRNRLSQPYEGAVLQACSTCRIPRGMTAPVSDSAAATLLPGPSCLRIMSRLATAHGSGMYSCLGMRRLAASSSS